MSASHPLLDASVLTLGTLLYQDESKARVSEGAWAALVAAIAAQDVRALHMLYAQMQGFVFTIALRICANRATAEEVTVDVFHEVWRRAGRYHPADGTVVGWVMNLARSRAIDRLRHDTRKKRVVAGTDASEAAVADVDLVEQRERMARVKAALGTLTEDERVAIEQAYFSDSSQAEIARRLELPLGTIKSRIRSALTKLRFALVSEGVP
jgi:RNA polymerase sigma-70 factor (ECF subfamily)